MTSQLDAVPSLRAFVTRLNSYAQLDDEALERLHSVPHAISILQGGAQIVREGERTDKAFVVEDGWAMRYRMLDDGRRQIVNFMIAGDLFDLQSFVGENADHAVEAITQLRLRVFSPRDLLKGLFAQTDLMMAMWWATLQEEGILREQIVRMGRRSAGERISHLALELARRLQVAGLFEGRKYGFPLTQGVLADALGLSHVHVGRSLKRLRERNLLNIGKGWAEILDHKALVAYADFDPNYLHLDAGPSRMRLLHAMHRSAP